MGSVIAGLGGRVTFCASRLLVMSSRAKGWEAQDVGMRARMIAGFFINGLRGACLIGCPANKRVRTQKNGGGDFSLRGPETHNRGETAGGAKKAFVRRVW